MTSEYMFVSDTGAQTRRWCRSTAETLRHADRMFAPGLGSVRIFRRSDKGFVYTLTAVYTSDGRRF